MIEQPTNDALTPEELDAQEAEELPDREAMSVLCPDHSLALHGYPELGLTERPPLREP